MPRPLLRSAVVAATLALPACGGPHTTAPDASDSGAGVGDAGPLIDGGDATSGDDVQGPGDDGAVTVLEAGSTDVLGTTGGACSTLMNTAAPIVEATSEDPLPAPTGGTIADGWYYLVASTTYGARGTDAGASGDAGDDSSDAGDDAGDAIDAGGVVRQAALLIASGRVVYAIERRGSEPNQTATYTLATGDAGALTLTEVCPVMAPTTIDGYDATATSLALHDSAAQRVDRYARQ